MDNEGSNGMPERADIKMNSHTTIAERVSEPWSEVYFGYGNKIPFHFGMVYFQNEN
jgi:hypothetical protein